jgi:hypothetical protein
LKAKVRVAASATEIRAAIKPAFILKGLLPKHAKMIWCLKRRNDGVSSFSVWMLFVSIKGSRKPLDSESLALLALWAQSMNTAFLYSNFSCQRQILNVMKSPFQLNTSILFLFFYFAHACRT